MKKILFLTLLFSTAAFAQNGVRRISPDFFVAPKDSPWFARRAPRVSRMDDDACREHIEQILCLVERGEDGKPRHCLQERDLKPAAVALQTIYDVYPVALKSVFCGLNRIYLEKKFIGTAYAGMGDDGKSTILGIRADLLLNHSFSLQDWVSWKEQLNFGGKQEYGSRDDLVKIEASTTLAPPANDFLYYVISHEFGHILDFQNKVNDWECDQAGDTCVPRPGSWEALSWSRFYPKREPTVQDPWDLLAYEPNDAGRFDHREELCFYGCADGHGDASLMRPLYESLQASNFITAYSTTNPWDDFAETVAFYAGTRYINLHYQVKLPDGTRFDLADKFLHAPRFEPKREWTERFFQKFENPPGL